MRAAERRAAEDAAEEDAYVARLVAAAPPFTARQRERIAAILGRRAPHTETARTGVSSRPGR